MPEYSRPWVELRELTERRDVRGLEAFLAGLSPGDTARAFANLDAEISQDLLLLMSPAEAAAAIDEIPESQAADLIEHLPSAEAAAIVTELPSDEQADLLGQMAEEQAEIILDDMPADAAKSVRELSRYGPEQCGGLMIKEFLAYPRSATVQAVIDDFRAQAERYRGYDVLYAYVTDERGRLVGVAPLRSLLLAPHDSRIEELMTADPQCLGADLPLEALRDFFARDSFYGAPVIDEEGILLGVVRRSDVQEALETRAERDHLKTQGITGGEELRSMGALRRSSHRLSWLSVNIALNVIAASVIAFYQETLSAVIALAVFLPIISDMSGCSGNQAVAVSLRELTAGLVRPVDALRVWLKELSVGLINGAALGLLIGAVGWLWKGNPYLGLVVGTALALNTLIAVSIGGVIPLALKRLDVDPAIASGPILTTVTDMCGFFLLLGLATQALPLLAPP